MNYDHVWQFEDSYENPQYRATEANVTNRLNYIVDNANAGDIIAFIFSGHGDNGTTSPVYSLCMWDANVGQGGYDGYLNHTELADIFEDCTADRIFLFFDNCYSYGMKEAIDDLDNSGSFFLAAAADIDEYAFEDDLHDLGCWTYCFLEYAWYGESNYSISESFDYIFENGYTEYRTIATNPNHPDWYNANTFPKKYNGYGYDFCLSKYWIQFP